MRRTTSSIPSNSCAPCPAGEADVRLGWLQWIVLLVTGIALGLLVSRSFTIILLALWLQGALYNLEPIRTKDLPYLDVLSEGLNNPLRMAAGWYMVDPPSAALPISLLLSYWMIGCYFMAIKRYAELRHMGHVIDMARYRRVFAFYSESRLLTSIVFYASAAILFLGAFIMRYRMELVLSFPLVALVMSVYLTLAFKPDSAVQAPERLYREPVLMVSVVVCVAVMVLLLFVDLPFLHDLFQPTLPTADP